jgi:hypothetical protein
MIEQDDVCEGSTALLPGRFTPSSVPARDRTSSAHERRSNFERLGCHVSAKARALHGMRQNCYN